MGLLDNLKNRRQGGDSGKPGGAGGSAAKPSNRQSIQQWLDSNPSEWAKCDAKAPQQSETTAETVRKLLQEYLPLNDEATIQRMEMLLLSWSVQTPISLSVCQDCGFHLQVMGNLKQESMPTSCKECRGKMVTGQMIYSRDVGRAARDFLASHARCIEAINAMVGSVRGGKPDMQQFDQLTKQALSIAKREGHRKAETTIVRTNLSVQLAYISALAETGVHIVLQPGGGASAKTGGKPQITVEATAEFLQYVSRLSHACLDANEPKLAISSYEKVIDLRAKLLDRFPQQRALRVAQAYDLDELGMTLRQHEPQRRPEALTLVRKAMEMMDALNHDDPSGRAELEEACKAIRAHLNLAW